MFSFLSFSRVNLIWFFIFSVYVAFSHGELCFYNPLTIVLSKMLDNGNAIGEWPVEEAAETSYYSKKIRQNVRNKEFNLP